VYFGVYGAMASSLVVFEDRNKASRREVEDKYEGPMPKSKGSSQH
jgi:hypothetical protein